MVPNILETEEERRAREMELERARFGLGVGSPMAPSGSDKPFVAPPAFADPSGPAKTASASDAVYGSSPAAMLFRQKTAQIAPSAPMATGFERNPVKFNNELNIPNKPQQAPKQLDVLAPPTAGEPPLGAAPAAAPEKPKPGTEDIIGPPARQQSLRQRQIEDLRGEIANWKTSFWDKSKFSNRQAEYQNKIRALDQLEQAEAAEQRVRREDRDYQLSVDKWNWEKSKPITVSPDASLATPKPGGGFEFTPAPSRPTPSKPLDPRGSRVDDEGNTWDTVFDPNTGEYVYKKAPFKSKEPADPMSRFWAAQEAKIKAEERAEGRKKTEAENAERKQRELKAAEEFVEILKDTKTYKTQGQKAAAMRRVAKLYGVADPSAPVDAPALRTGGAPAKPQAAAPAAPDAPAGGVDAVVTRDANGNLVMSPAR